MTKTEVRVFLDDPYHKVVKELVKKNFGSTESEVVRTMVREWIKANMPERLKLPELARKSGKE